MFSYNVEGFNHGQKSSSMSGFKWNIKKVQETEKQREKKREKNLRFFFFFLGSGQPALQYKKSQVATVRKDMELSHNLNVVGPQHSKVHSGSSGQRMSETSA